MKLVISSDTFLKTQPENPDLLGDNAKIPVQVGEWLEVEKVCEYPLGHWQISWKSMIWYCYKINAFVES